MIRLALRCVPADGPPDLTWVAGLTGSLDEIYQFLLRAEIGAYLTQDGDHRAWTAAEAQKVVNGRATELGGPAVRLSDDPPVIELAADVVTTTLPVQALASLALLLGTGPDVAGWPRHVKRAWFGPGRESRTARRAYDWIRRKAVVQVVVADRAHAATRPPKHKMASGQKRRADLPPGVRRAPPLS
jgi:hypothetical protein